MSLTTYIDHPLATGVAPPWASGWGDDRFGPFVEISVGELTQRLRWLPPGEFMMGVAEGDDYRQGESVGQRRVTVSRGSWMFDTPCTQGLWKEVMGENPSHFQEDEWERRPVERVSWDDCQSFLSRLNERLDGLTLELPDEVRWEYACRAGTTEQRYGDLDSIAWYHKNSDGKTHAVGQLKPNDWRFFDMLGHVFEWCSDPYDPQAKDKATPRVFRGGSWRNDARLARAAYRFPSHPGDRFAGLGFRCSSSVLSEPGEIQ